MEVKIIRSKNYESERFVIAERLYIDIKQDLKKN